MKIVINSDKVKRQIDGNFSICASREDFKSLVYRINTKLGDNFTYGWIDIYDPVLDVPDTKPEPWVSVQPEQKSE